MQVIDFGRNHSRSDTIVGLKDTQVRDLEKLIAISCREKIIAISFLKSGAIN